MDYQFQAGDIAVLCNATYYHEYDGYLCLLHTGFKKGTARDLNTMKSKSDIYCSVEILGAAVIYGLTDNQVLVAPYQLRKIEFRDIQPFIEEKRIPKEESKVIMRRIYGVSRNKDVSKQHET